MNSLEEAAELLPERFRIAFTALAGLRKYRTGDRVDYVREATMMAWWLTDNDDTIDAVWSFVRVWLIRADVGSRLQ